MPCDGEHELIRKVLDGDPVAAESFVDRYQALVYTILRTDFRLPQSLAEDMFQNVFVHLWENDCHRLRQWKGKGKFSSYLAVIVSNLTRDFLRTHSISAPWPDDEAQEETDELPDPGRGPQRAVELQEIRHALRWGMERLPPRDRELLERRYDGEQSYKQIARAMNLSVNQVGVYLSRAEARLKKILNENIPGYFWRKPMPQCKNTSGFPVVFKRAV